MILNLQPCLDHERQSQRAAFIMALVPKPILYAVPPADPSPAEKVRQRIKRAPKPAAVLQCNRCGGREVIETKTGVEYAGGKTRGGTKATLCALCFSSGERVVLA